VPTEQEGQQQERIATIVGTCGYCCTRSNLRECGAGQLAIDFDSQGASPLTAQEKARRDGGPARTRIIGAQHADMTTSRR
jgi:hypothetical protein